MEDLLSLISTIFWLFFWFWVGGKMYDRLRSIREKNTISLQSNLLENVKAEKLYSLKTETHNGIIFAFTVKEDMFICQGETIEEVAEVAYKYRRINLAYVLHNRQFMWFIDGKVTNTVKVV